MIEKEKKELKMGYKAAIIWAWIFRVLFFFGISSVCSSVYEEIKTDTFNVFSVIGYGGVAMFLYFVFWKLAAKFQKMCREQMKRIDNGEMIWVKVTSIHESRSSSYGVHGMRNSSAVTIYTCVDDDNLEFDVIRVGRRYTDVVIGQRINVFRWSDPHRTYHEWPQEYHKLTHNIF